MLMINAATGRQVLENTNARQSASMVWNSTSHRALGRQAPVSGCGSAGQELVDGVEARLRRGAICVHSVPLSQFQKQCFTLGAEGLF